jgi:Fic family protein
MYEPQYQITDKLLNNITKLEVLRATANTSQLNYNVRSKLNLQTKGANLFHLSHMLNLNIGLKDAEKMAEGRKLEIEDEKIKLVHNFRNILEFNRSSVAESYTELDFTVLLHLNKIVLTGWKESWEVKVRGLTDQIDLTNEDWATFTDRQLAPADVEPALVDALSWYQTTNGRVNNFIRVTVLILRLIQIMPFLAGNKFTIMAIADLLLYQYGYLSALQVPITRAFDQSIIEFWKIWDAVNQNADLTPWLEKYSDTLVREFGEVKADIDKLVQEETERNTNQPFLDLNKRQLKVLRYLQTIPTVRREDYCQMMDVSTMTAFRDLNDLVRKKLLRVEGQGRGTRYTLVSR